MRACNNNYNNKKHAGRNREKGNGPGGGSQSDLSLSFFFPSEAQVDFLTAVQMRSELRMNSRDDSISCKNFWVVPDDQDSLKGL